MEEKYKVGEATQRRNRRASNSHTFYTIVIFFVAARDIDFFSVKLRHAEKSELIWLRAHKMQNLAAAAATAAVILHACY